MYPVGTFKSKKRAEEIAEKLGRWDKADDSAWVVLAIESVDKYTDESIIDYAKSL